MEKGAGAHRLPRRNPAPPLLRTLSVGQTPVGCAGNRARRGVVAQGPAGRQSPTLASARRPHHGGRTHAQGASGLCPVDAATLGPLGREQRSVHRRAGAADPGYARSSATGLPQLPGPHAAGQTLRRQAPGGRLPARPGTRRLRLQERGVDLEKRPGPQTPATGHPRNSRHRPTATCAVRTTTTDPQGEPPHAVSPHR